MLFSSLWPEIGQLPNGCLNPLSLLPRVMILASDSQSSSATCHVRELHTFVADLKLARWFVGWHAEQCMTAGGGFQDCRATNSAGRGGAVCGQMSFPVPTDPYTHY